MKYVEHYLSFWIGMPFRVLMTRKMHARLEELWEFRVYPYWSASHGWHWLTQPMIATDPGDGSQNTFRLYVGHFAGVCRLGHQHFSAPHLLSFRVLWWNCRHGKPLLNFVQQGFEGQVDDLMAGMKHCGFSRREPMFPEREVTTVGPRTVHSEV